MPLVRPVRVRVSQYTNAACAAGACVCSQVQVCVLRLEKTSSAASFDDVSFDDVLFVATTALPPITYLSLPIRQVLKSFPRAPRVQCRDRQRRLARKRLCVTSTAMAGAAASVAGVGT